MMHLYLVRHAIAEELPEQMRFGDDLRALTPKGRTRFRRTARHFARLEEPLDLICTSPMLRAVQTAELLAAAVDHDEVTVLDELRPDAAVDPLLARLGDFHSRAVAVVGHKRLLRELAAVLADVESERIKFRRGAIACIDVRHIDDRASAKPLWWLAPTGGQVTPGLPLDEGAPG